MANITEYNDSHAHMVFTPIQICAAIKILENNAFIRELLDLDLLEGH